MKSVFRGIDVVTALVVSLHITITINSSVELPIR